jgi:hypothetical protein
MSNGVGYDLIGDIHGQYGKLEALLKKLGYAERADGWVPPLGRQALFLGDLVDRGPEQVRVLHTVRSMIDAGHARSIMGNHEFNAIGWVTPREDGLGFLRKHSDKNLGQHAEFLRQVGEGSADHRAWVDWFRTLPVALDLGGLRLVHAWWHQPYVDLVASRWPDGQAMSDEFLHAAYAKGSPEWTAMEGLSKGLEMRLPDGHGFTDHSGIERYEVRARWWHEAPRTWRDVAIVGDDQAHRVPDHPLPEEHRAAWWPVDGERAGGPPVFIGHYWMSGEPVPQARRVACLDWSAAKDGPLVAYRWDGEAEIEARRFVAAGV